MTYSLTQEQIKAAISGKDLRTYKGWVAAAEALLSDAPEWTAIEQEGGCYTVKVKIDGEFGISSCAKNTGNPDAVYGEEDLGDFDCSAWNGESWDGLSAEENVASLTTPVFVALRHAYQGICPRGGAARDREMKEDSSMDNGQITPFQTRVRPWLLECFGQEIASDAKERNHRFLEESLELVQACGCTQSEAHQLVDYVYGRDVGEKHQEVGGVMVTLAALCLAQQLDMHDCGEVELARIWTKVEQIRAKQAAKPKHSPLPQHVALKAKQAA